MKRSQYILIILGIGILAGMVVVSYRAMRPGKEIVPAPSLEVPLSPMVIYVKVPENFVVIPETTRVEEGTRIVIKVDAGTSDEVHLHGYDAHAELMPGRTAEISFTATKTGRFEFELEKAKKVLGVIEVYPR